MPTLESAPSLVFAAVIAGGVGMCFWMIQKYFDGIHRHLARLEGHIESMRADMHEHTKAIVQAQTELKALWRVADAPKRTSDRISEGGFS